MVISVSDLHLRRARGMQDPRSAIEEYLKAIEKAVREMRGATGQSIRAAPRAPARQSI